MTSIIIKIKNTVKEIPCISILDPSAKLIVETDASELGYGGILKQIPPNSSKEQIVKYYSGIWNQAQKNYPTVKKEILAIVLCVSKFQEDLFNKTFLIRTDCKAAPNVLENDVKNLNFCRERMEQKPASSDDYGQPFDQVKETKLPIIPVPAKPLSLRPMTMSQVVKASSSSSLPSKSPSITTNNKFTLLQPSDLYNIQPLKEQFPYYEKPNPIKILTIEKEWFKKDRKTLYKTIFPNTFHYIPINPQKTQKFYEFILVDTGSIELTHYRDSNTKQPIYSKIKIMKILSLQE
ncbi:hypothetical protein AHAS_Ahas05G0143300 [Arachis hypogaea]